MEPRLTSSTSWTTVPGELLQQMSELLTEHFTAQATKGTFVVEGRIYSEEILMRYGYLMNSKLTQHNFEFSVPYKFKKENLLEIVHLTFDLAAQFFAEGFADVEELWDYSRKWDEIEANKKSLSIRYSTTNSKLEDEADRLLGVKKDTLVVEDEGDPKIETLISAEDEDDEDPLPPKGKKKHFH